MGIKFARVDGMKQLRDSLGHFTKNIDTRPYEILLEEAPRITEEAVMRVPVDTGALRDSIRTQVTRRGKTRAQLETSASATNPRDGYDYAKIQHDNVFYHHPNGGGPFYLSIPFNEASERIDRRLREEVKYDR